MNYDPQPIQTNQVSLPEGLQSLIEKLAENAHEVWAMERLAQGWKHGPARDDRNKLHPCLIPYADLPESEKEYDRKTVVATIKSVLALGYRIERP